MPKIEALTVTNFKRIGEVAIEPGGRQLVIIGGKNAQGKSSTLDAVAGVLAGKGALPAEPIRRGEDRGCIEVTLDNGITIRRTLTRKDGGKVGGTLKITTADGMSPSGGAQRWLDKRVGAMTVDPLAFISQDSKRQAEQLRQVAGIQVADIDADIARLTTERRDIGRDAKRARAAADSATRYPDAPEAAPEAAVQSVADVMAEVSEAEATVQCVRDAERHLGQCVDAVDKGRAAVAEVDRDIARLTAALEAAQEKRAKYTVALAAREDAVEEAQGAVKAAEAAVIDPGPVREKLRGLEQANADARAEAAAVARKVEANRAADAKAAEASKLEAEYTAMTEAIEAKRKERRERIASASLPVEGLGLSEDGVVTFDGLPLSQASRAQQMRVSLAVALAGTDADGIRVALIRDASLLDDDSMQLVADLAAEMDAQVWLERVGDADDGAVIIEDGGVRG